jgi:hypothetical protein
MSEYTLKEIPAEAHICMGPIIVKTPYIKSVNVSRVRGEIVGKASFTFRWSGDTQDISSNAMIVIKFRSSTIFTGYAKRVNVSPSMECANEFLIRVQAEDIMYKIINKRINRRQKKNGLGPLAFITSIHKRPYLGFDDPNDVNDISGGRSPYTLDGDSIWDVRNRLFDSGQNNSNASLHPVAKNTEIPNSFSHSLGGGGMELHDHTTLDITGPHAGGPAKAVYGVK